MTNSEVVPIAVCSKASQELLLFQRVESKVDTLEFSIGSPRKKVEWYVQVESEMRIERDQVV